MPPTTHSKLGASSAHRWMKCPGSVALCANIPPTTSKYAEEGTRAHKLAEDCLRKDTLAAKSLAPLEMAAAVDVYIKHVRSVMKRLTGSVLHVEQGFHLDHLDEELWGTNDATIDQPFGTLAVLDYKHGQGHKVEAEGNVQCLFYALGAIRASQGVPETVEVHIVQPRCPVGDPVSVWAIDREEVIAWGQTVLLPAVHATRQPNAPLVPGEHCQFCPAKTQCKAIEQAACEAAGLAFGPVGLPAKRDIVLPVPADMDADKVARVLDFADVFGPWVKAVQEEAKERLMAGKPVTGWKLVEGRRTRAWIDPDSVPSKLACFGSAIYKTELLSPAQMEKAVKEANGSLDALKGLITETKGVAMVPVSDKRQAITVDATQAFETIKEN